MNLVFEAMSREEFTEGRSYEVRITESQKAKDVAVVSRWIEKPEKVPEKIGTDGFLVVDRKVQALMKGSTWSDEQIAVMIATNVIPVGTPAPVIYSFLHQCQKRGLDPVNKEIYLMQIQGRWCMHTGIDGMKKKAAETGEFAGCEKTKYDGLLLWEWIRDNGPFTYNSHPNTASIVVKRVIDGQICEFPEEIIINEYKPHGGGRIKKWKDGMHQMSSKSVLGRGLRLGFGDALAGVFATEELDYLQNKGRAAVSDNLISQMSTCDKEQLIALKESNQGAMQNPEFVDAFNARFEELEVKI